MAQKELQKLSIEEWIRKSTLAPLSHRIALGIIALFLLFLSLVNVYIQISWDSKIKTWDKVPCTILFNGEKIRGSGRSRKKVASVKYSYNYKGRSYQGNRIVYGSDSFPQWVKAGDKRTVIVNPARPGESAVLFTYKGFWFLLRYIPAFLFAGVFLIVGTLFMRSIKKHPPVLPEKLISYLHSFTPEKINALPLLKRPFSVKSNIYMDFPAEEPDKDILLIKSRKTLTGLFILILFLFLFALASFVFQKPLILIYTLFLFILIFLHVKFPAVLVMDFPRKCLYRCKKYSPEKMLKEEKNMLSFEEVDFLSLQAFPESNEYLLCAVRLDGSMYPLFKIRGKNLSSYGEILPVIAEKMGNLPVILR